jgi:hypothetical protein
MTGELFRLGDLFSISVLLAFRYCYLFLSSFSQDTLSCPDVGNSGQIQSVSMPPQISQKIRESDHKKLQEFVIVALVPFTRLKFEMLPAARSSGRRFEQLCHINDWKYHVRHSAHSHTL